MKITSRLNRHQYEDSFSVGSAEWRNGLYKEQKEWIEFKSFNFVV
jgi:hypothetical protein